MPKYIEQQFNDLCTELNLQCLITMNVRDYQLDYQFKNLGGEPVILFTDKWSEVTAPLEQKTIKMPNQDTPWMAHFDE